jgi:hypothetical protein
LSIGEKYLLVEASDLGYELAVWEVEIKKFPERSQLNPPEEKTQSII